MIRIVRQILVAAALALVSVEAHADPLPSWNAGTAKQRIIEFVTAVTDPEGADFVPAERRIAVFDNDGTLWAEQPLYFQIFFALEGVAERAKADPSILTSDVLKAAAAGDVEGALAQGVDGLLEIINASHSDIHLEEFEAAAVEWLATARNPETGQLYTEMVYQPMLELLSYLRDRGFLTYVVSAGGTDFMRAFSEEAYGVPPQQVIGSLGNARYEADGAPAIRLAADGNLVVALEDISPEAILAAIEFLRSERGSETVTLIGASAGADTSLDALSDQPGAADGLITLSVNSTAEGLGPEPKLFIASEEEAGAGQSVALAENSEGSENRVLLLPGSSHAQAIFDSDQSGPAMRAILRQVRAGS